MRILILANGDPPSVQLAHFLAGEHDLLIAVDGAALRAVELGLKPHIICGDFDSAQPDDARRAFPDSEFVLLADQDRGDLEKALLLAIDRGGTRITIAGAAGGRVDHTLANFALLLQYGEVPCSIVDDFGVTYCVSGTADSPGVRAISTSIGDVVSLVTFDGAARVTLTGTRWPLYEELLPIGTRGISNVAVTQCVEVHVHSGAILVSHINPSRLLAKHT